MASSGGSSGVSDACVFVSLALFIVWMQRQKVTTLSNSPTRWGAFFGALGGKYTISSNVSSSSSSTSPGATSSDTSAAATSPTVSSSSTAPLSTAQIQKITGLGPNQ